MERLIWGIIFAILGIACYLLYDPLLFYYCNQSVKSEANAIVKVGNDVEKDEIVRRLMEKVRECDIPLTKDDWEIEQSRESVSIRTKYKEIWGYEYAEGKFLDLHTFEFEVDERNDF